MVLTLTCSTPPHARPWPRFHYSELMQRLVFDERVFSIKGRLKEYLLSLPRSPSSFASLIKIDMLERGSGGRRCDYFFDFYSFTRTESVH